MKRRKKFVAIVLGALIGTMSCMTVLAASMCPVAGCGYVSDMCDREADDYERTGEIRTCQHGKAGYDGYYKVMQVFRYYCSEDHPSWLDYTHIGYTWICEAE